MNKIFPFSNFFSPKFTMTMRHKVTMETSSTYKNLAGSTKKQKTKSVFEF